MVRGAAVARRVTWAIPGDIATVTGGYAYDRRLIAELRQRGWDVELVGLGEGFPRLTREQKAVAEARLLAAAQGQPMVVDGLAFGVLPEVAVPLHRTCPLVALVHHPLGLETGLNAAEAAQLLTSERAALASTRCVVATSPWTGRVLVERFGVPSDRLAVILPGTDRAPFSTGSREGPLRLISVGAIGARKSFDVLVEALAPLTALSWHLTIVGDRERDARAVARLEGLITRHRLEEHVECVGKVSPERLAALYAGADLFVLASRFEGYGMAFAEALAHGLPVIGTTGGATPSTVPPSAGRLVAPGSIAELSTALRTVIADRDLREQLRAGAQAAAENLPSWSESAAQFSALLTKLT
jgi:glycosyltransferase involved in cell wall biosynthesis